MRDGPESFIYLLGCFLPHWAVTTVTKSCYFEKWIIPQVPAGDRGANQRDQQTMSQGFWWDFKNIISGRLPVCPKTPRLKPAASNCLKSALTKLEPCSSWVSLLFLMISGMQHTVAAIRVSLCNLRRHTALATKCIPIQLVCPPVYPWRNCWSQWALLRLWLQVVRPISEYLVRFQQESARFPSENPKLSFE